MKPTNLIFCFILLVIAFVGEIHAAEEVADSESTRYFPTGSVSDFEQKWYAQHLHAMEEPVFKPDQDKEYFALRVLYLPTWGPPVAFRYERRGESTTHRAVMLSGSGGYAPGTVKTDLVNEPSQQEVTKVMLDLAESGYWKLSDKDDVLGSDGSQLIIETIRGGKQRVFVRWTPEHESEMRDLDKLVEFFTKEFSSSGRWPDK